MRTVKLLLVVLCIGTAAFGATVTAVAPTTSTSNVTSYASSAFTPAANDLLAVYVVASGTKAYDATLTDSQGLGFVLVSVAAKVSSADTIYLFVAKNLASASSMTVTFDCSSDAATGAVINVFRISGMTRTGFEAVRQTSGQNNQAAATPAPVFGANVLTGNPVIGVIGNATNPATLTPPTSWTEGGDVGYATPTTGAETAFVNSGFTGTTVTWGSASGSAFGSLIAEFDTSATSSYGIDTVSSPSSGNFTGTSTSWTHTCSGTNRFLLVMVSVVDNTANRDLISGVTYNGTALKYLGRIPDYGGSELYQSAWVMVAPSTGSNTITITHTDLASGGTGLVDAAAISFVGVNQSYPYYLPTTYSTGTSTATTYTMTVGDSGSADSAYVVGWTETHNTNILPDPKQSLIYNQVGMNNGSAQGAGASFKRSEVGNTFTWTQGASDVAAGMGIAIRPASATPTEPFLDGVFTSVTGTSVSSLSTTNITASGGTNGLFFYTVGYTVSGNVATNISSVSWNSRSFTKLDEQRFFDGTNTWATEIWYLKNPSSATATLTATFGGTFGSVTQDVTPWLLVDQSSTFGTVAKANDTSGTSFHPSVTVTSQSGSVVQDVSMESNGTLPYTVQTGSQIYRTEYGNSSIISSHSQVKQGAASVTMDYNTSAGGGASNFNIMGVGIKFSSGGGVTIPDSSEGGVSF